MMPTHSILPYEIKSSLWRNRFIIRNLIRHEILTRFKGSLLGLTWSIIIPVATLAVYTLVFGAIIGSRWEDVALGGQKEFALVLFSGLMFFNLFSEVIIRSPGIILANQNYVKKVIFPLEVFPMVIIGSALFQFFVSLCVWIVGYLIIVGVPHWTLTLLPIVLLPLVMFTAGLSWILAAVGVYVRDIGQVIGVSLTFLIFLTPIFYPLSAIPPELLFLFMLNPLTSAIEMARNLLYFGYMPNVKTLIIYYAVACSVFTFGFAVFQRARNGFADVL